MRLLKNIILICLISIFIGCEVTETIYLNNNGTGKIEVVQLRDEQSIVQFTGDKYSKKEVFVDTTYVFKDFISKYSETFSRLTPEDKAVFLKYEEVNAHIKMSSLENDYRTTYFQDFSAIEKVPDLYKTGEYVSDVKSNYALSAEEHYYHISYSFDGTFFKRMVKITNLEQLKKEQDRITKVKSHLKFKVKDSFVLKYYFPRNIKSVSNSKSILSDDKKSLELHFLLSDCLQNPEITNLEVVLEP